MDYDLTFFAKIIGAIAAIVTSVTVIHSYLIRPLYLKLRANLLFMWRVAIDAASINDLIKRELTYNGGSSIKDSIKRIEENINNSSFKLKAVLSLKQEPIWESDENGNCKWVNDAYIRITGYSLEHLKNLGWLMTVKESERKNIEYEWLRSINEKRTFNQEMSIKTSSSTFIKVHAHGFPIMTHDNKLSGYMGILNFNNKENNHG